MVTDELAVILVGSHHVHIHLRRTELRRNGAKDVIGLETADCKDGDIHGLNQLSKRFQRIDYKLRSRRTRTLVLGIHLVPERSPRRVESHHHMRGILPLEHLQKVFGKPIEDGHVLPLGVYHRPSEKGVVHLEHQGVSVNQQQFSHDLQLFLDRIQPEKQEDESGDDGREDGEYHPDHAANGGLVGDGDYGLAGGGISTGDEAGKAKEKGHQGA